MSKLTNEMRAIKLGDYREGTLIVMLSEAADLIDVLRTTADVVDELQKQIARLERNNFDLLDSTKLLKEMAQRNSWEGQVDRQGGSFTQDEINGFDGWGRN